MYLKNASDTVNIEAREHWRTKRKHQGTDENYTDGREMKTEVRDGKPK